MATKRKTTKKVTKKDTKKTPIKKVAKKTPISKKPIVKKPVAKKAPVKKVTKPNTKLIKAEQELKNHPAFIKLNQLLSDGLAPTHKWAVRLEVQLEPFRKAVEDAKK